MFDTISSFLVTKESMNLNYLSNFREITESGMTTLKGDLDNLSVKQVYDGISIYGSLAKFYFGNNLETLTRQTTQYAIERMSDELSVNLRSSQIFRIDIATNLIMKEPVKDYLKWFGDCRYLTKSNFNGTLYYSNKRRKFVAYDKLKEFKDKGQTIPTDFDDYHKRVLRFELRYLKRLKDQFKREVFLSDLYSEVLYCEVLKRWKDAYFLINKVKQIIPDQMNYLTSKGYKDSLIISQINERGLDQVLSEIEANRDKFKNSVEASRCKAAIKELANNESYTEQSELILELDAKVKQAVQNYR